MSPPIPSRGYHPLKACYSERQAVQGKGTVMWCGQLFVLLHPPKKSKGGLSPFRGSGTETGHAGPHPTGPALPRPAPGPAPPRRRARSSPSRISPRPSRPWLGGSRSGRGDGGARTRAAQRTSPSGAEIARGLSGRRERSVRRLPALGLGIGPRRGRRPEPVLGEGRGAGLQPRGPAGRGRGFPHRASLPACPARRSRPAPPGGCLRLRGRRAQPGFFLHQPRWDEAGAAAVPPRP